MEEEQAQESDTPCNYTPVSYHWTLFFFCDLFQLCHPRRGKERVDWAVYRNGAHPCDARNKAWYDAKRCEGWSETQMSVTSWIPPGIYLKYLQVAMEKFLACLMVYWKTTDFSMCWSEPYTVVGYTMIYHIGIHHDTPSIFFFNGDDNWRYLFLSHPSLSCSLAGLSTSESSHGRGCQQSGRDHDSAGPGLDDGASASWVINGSRAR